MSINLELEKIFYEDKEQRTKLDYAKQEELDKLSEDFNKRLERVKAIIENEDFDESEIWNLHYAAYILHHSESKSDVKLANNLAAKAIALGSRVTKWLYAATLDRYLIMEGKSQKFGTQYRFEDGKWITQPVEKSTTDKEREEFGVKPLAEYLSNNYK